MDPAAIVRSLPKKQGRAAGIGRSLLTSARNRRKLLYRFPMPMDSLFIMSDSKYLTSPPDTPHLPKGIPYIVGNEAAERFSFYGMKSILAIFMTKHLLDAAGQSAVMDNAEATEWVHNFGSAVYFFPIVGAVLADWLFGKYHTILTLSIVYCCGHAVLALMDVPQWTGLQPRSLLAIGLGLIAIGGGGIKPCVSAHVGDQFGKTNQHLLSRVFGWFYFSINFGAMFSTMLTPILLKRLGPGWAFGVPGILMAIATVVFWMGRHVFVHIPPAGTGFFRETFGSTGRKAFFHLVPLYFFVAMFWALFDQTASRWVLQAEHMDRTVLDLPLPSDQDHPPFWHNALQLILTPVQPSPGADHQNWELLSSQIQAVNPLLVMILIPVFTYGIYPLFGRFFEVTPLRKIGLGLFITVLAFTVPTAIQLRIDQGGQPHIIWQVVAYLVITCAEIMVSITALEFSYTQAPRKMKSFIMGLFLLSVSAGNVFVSRVNAFIQNQEQQTGTSLLDGANYYKFWTAAILLTAILFVVWSQFYQGTTYIQGDEHKPESDPDLLEPTAAVEP